MKRDASFEQAVYRCLCDIPSGCVVTYGQLAALIGKPGAARAVGNALHHNLLPDLIPCFRVVNAQGHLAEHFGAGGIREHRRRLEADGIEVRADDTVDLSRYQWHPKHQISE